MNHPIWIIEDRPDIGNTLVENLTDRGFEASYFQTPQAVFDHLKTSTSPPAVVVLDMDLGTELNGLDVGRKIAQEFSNCPPEILIYSAYEEKEYFKGGYSIGAATYLIKGEVTPRQATAWIRALYQRWLLKYNWTLRIRQIRAWVWSCPSWSDILEKAFRKFISDNPRKLFGADYLLFLKNDEGTLHYSSLPNLAKTHPIYDQILDRVRNHPLPEHYELSPQNLGFKLEQDMAASLEGLRFMQVYQSPSLTLALGLKEHDDFSESIDDLVSSLSAILKPSILENNIREMLHAIESEQSRKSMVELTEAFCTSIGERHQNLFEAAVKTGEFTGEEKHTRQLKELGRDLQQMGLVFRDLRRQKHKIKEINAQDIIRFVWTGMSNNRQENFTLEGDPCLLYADPSTIKTGFTQIFRWMVGRMDHSAKPKPWIKVICQQPNPTEAIITLSDTSDRLPDDLRRSLFLPFSNFNIKSKANHEALGLYTAKMCLESRGQGELRDVSNQFANTRGHTFQVKLNSFKARA